MKKLPTFTQPFHRSASVL